MDVTPQVLHEVEFRAKVRGYDPDEVDDFLERVAVGVAQLQDRLRDAMERAAAAESRTAELQAKLKESPAGGETDDMLRRTLVLAQRTADAAIREANDEAARVRSEATEQATTLVSGAEERAAALLKDAEDEVRKGVEATRQRLVSEIIDLEVTRDSVRADITALERHLDEQRLRLRGAVSDLQRLLDDPAALRGLPAPLLTEATLPARIAVELGVEEPAEVDDEREDDIEPDAEGEDELALDEAVDDVELEPDDSAEEVDAEADADEVDDGEVVLALDDEESAPSVRGDEEHDWSVIGKGRIGLFDDLAADDELRHFEFDPPGQRTEPVGRIPEGPEGDDAYLAELRKAMLTTDADDDDDDLPPLPLGDADQAPKFRSRFGRRR